MPRPSMPPRLEESSRLMMLPLISKGFLRYASSSSVPAHIAIISPVSGEWRISRREVNVSNGLALFRLSVEAED
eukprot:2476487-Prymnesium_polylepis.1